MDQSQTDRVENIIRQGLPGYWYVVAKSADIKPLTPVSVRAFGRDLVLWRGEDGKLRCLEDYCPHRGARLSIGRATGNTLSCRYHGVTLNGEGVVVQVPGMAECALEGRRPLDSFAVEEAADGVFVYFPSAAQPSPPPLTLPKELTEPNYAHFLCVSSWACNYGYVLDNLVDPMHGIFLHSDTFTLSRGITQDSVTIEAKEHGFITKRVGQQDVNFDWSEIVVDGPVFHGRVIIPYPPAAGPGGPMYVITFVTPIDENNCRIFFWRVRGCENELQRESWRFLFRTNFEARHWYVLEQDREMLERMPTDARRREMLYQHDLGVTRLRRMMRRKVEAEIQATSGDRAAS
jgi:phenylpropionate dioxygenase-like ring-hydroxylating dioxygenase large terminal subunit